MLGKAALGRHLPWALRLGLRDPQTASRAEPWVSQLPESDRKLGGHVTLRSGPVGSEQVPGEEAGGDRQGCVQGTDGLWTG